MTGASRSSTRAAGAGTSPPRRLSGFQDPVGLDKKVWFIGDEVQKQRGRLNLAYPVSRGEITNWDHMEKVGSLRARRPADGAVRACGLVLWLQDTKAGPTDVMVPPPPRERLQTGTGLGTCGQWVGTLRGLTPPNPGLPVVSGGDRSRETRRPFPGGVLPARQAASTGGPPARGGLRSRPPSPCPPRSGTTPSTRCSAWPRSSTPCCSLTCPPTPRPTKRRWPR